MATDNFIELDSSFFNSSPIDETNEERWEWAPKERISESWKETLGALLGAGSAVADALGSERGRDWLAEKASRKFEEAADMGLSHTNFTEIDSPLDAAKWAAELLTGYLPDLALMAVGGMGLATGASRIAARETGGKILREMATRSFKKNYDELLKDTAKNYTEEEAIKAATKMTARNIGGLLGASSVEGVQSVGTFQLDQREALGDDANPFRSLGVGLGVSLISMLSPITRGVAGGISGKLPTAGIAKTIGKTTVGEFLEESGQEAWTMLNEAGINPDVTFGDLIASKEGQLRLLESGIAGAVLGSSFGAAGGALGKAFGKKAKGDITDPDTAKSVLEGAGVDTSQDTVLERDIPRVGQQKATFSMADARMKQENRDKILNTFLTPLEEIMMTRTVEDPDGNVVEVELAASEIVKDQDTKIEKWYQLRECLIS